MTERAISRQRGSGTLDRPASLLRGISESVAENVRQNFEQGCKQGMANALEELSMARSRKESAGPRTRRSRSRHRDDRDGRTDELGPSEAALLEEIDAIPQSKEDRAYAEARLVAEEIAEEKVQLWGKFWKIMIIGVPLLFFVTPVGFLVLFFGGISVARHAYRVLYEPQLRERLLGEEVAKEVSKKVQTSVHAERRNLEGEHARSIEKL